MERTNETVRHRPPLAGAGGGGELPEQKLHYIRTYKPCYRRSFLRT